MRTAEALRNHTEEEIVNASNELMQGMTEQAETIAVSADTKILAVKRQTVRVKRHDPVPDVEWWDAPLLLPSMSSYLSEEILIIEKECSEERQSSKKMEEEVTESEPLVQRLKRNLEILESELFSVEIFAKDKITNRVEHPASFTTDSGQNVVLPTYMTKDERKKLRHMRRLQREKEKQEKIKLGLIPPPKPKLKIINFMNILKDEAGANPTMVELKVRKAQEERQQAHWERNARRRLTKEKRAERETRKLKRDSAVECRVAVFRVDNLSYGPNRFKVNMNAKQLALNGVCITVDKQLGLDIPNVIVIEGGPKAIKFYKKLILRRINWNPETPKDEVEKVNTKKDEKKCVLVWEGVLKDYNFSKWKMVEIKSEQEGRRIFADRGMEGYWDRALSDEAIGEDEEEEFNQDTEIII